MSDPGQEPRVASPEERAAALSLLPHGEGFRFIDRLLELTPGKRGVGELRIRGDEQFLRGHFPGDPMMPGVLLAEAGAQLAGIVAQSDPAHAPLKGLKLAGVRNARFKGSARPGQTLRVEAELLTRMGGLVQARVRASVDGETVLEAEVTLGGQPQG